MTRFSPAVERDRPQPIDADAAISIRGLVKRYGDFVAVDGLDLDIRRGEIFALLGPNGAGKTTTVEICEGYRSRDAGEVRVLGRTRPTAPGRGRRSWASCCSPAPATASSPPGRCWRPRRPTTPTRAIPTRSSSSSV
ncbi:ATP-binding cassette domain-containing protein [Blastococcus brunescens]|uniref:ATP-binding cassette domain-containing protein n=1 Tax=Blastococcus brunescens TaxID=1564165 RepID=A0ABZ1AWN8_9ACTN|nr:ATP-binding cassette domain-containing protein [Blastococcus sp. BMG 8361]WRL62981.1 ATP-binding cassette domain-containing protein [Blastococcus sp. BMG 8361]